MFDSFISKHNNNNDNDAQVAAAGKGVTGYYYSNAPQGFYYYKYPEGSAAAKRAFGAKVFFYRVRYLKGKVKPAGGYVDYAWVRCVHVSCMPWEVLRASVHTCACARPCARACVRACVRVCALVCARTHARRRRRTPVELDVE